MDSEWDFTDASYVVAAQNDMINSTSSEMYGADLATSAMSLSEMQQKIIAILPIPAALLSVFGSSSIIAMAFRNRKQNLWTPYTRLLVGMSACDIVYSLTLSTSGFLYPEDSSSRVWTIGNDATCTAQGFLNQFSYSGILYNGMLSFYFLLSARFGIKNFKIAKYIEPGMHFFCIGYPLVTAVIGAVMGVYSEPTLGMGCWVNDYPKNCGEGPGLTGEECKSVIIAWIFGGALYILVFLAILVNNGIIWAFVRRQAWPHQRHKKQFLGNSSRNNSGSLHSIRVMSSKHAQDILADSHDFDRKVVSGLQHSIPRIPSDVGSFEPGQTICASSVDDIEMRRKDRKKEPLQREDVFFFEADNEAKSEKRKSNDSNPVPPRRLSSHSIPDLEDESCSSHQDIESPQKTNESVDDPQHNLMEGGRQIFGKRLSRDDPVVSPFIHSDPTMQSTISPQIETKKSEMNGEQVRRLKLVSSQALLFVSSYLISNLVTGILRIIESIAEDEAILPVKHYPLLVLQAWFLPLQGFLNMFVYVRPKYLKCRRNYPKESKSWAFRRAMYGDVIQPMHDSRCSSLDTEDARNEPVEAGKQRKTNSKKHSLPNGNKVSNPKSEKNTSRQKENDTNKNSTTDKGRNQWDQNKDGCDDDESDEYEQVGTTFQVPLNDDSEVVAPKQKPKKPKMSFPNFTRLARNIVSDLTASEGDFDVPEYTNELPPTYEDDEEDDEKVDPLERSGRWSADPSGNSHEDDENIHDSNDSHSKEQHALSTWRPMKLTKRYKSSSCNTSWRSSLGVISELTEVSFHDSIIELDDLDDSDLLSPDATVNFIPRDRYKQDAIDKSDDVANDDADEEASVHSTKSEKRVRFTDIDRKEDYPKRRWSTGGSPKKVTAYVKHHGPVLSLPERFTSPSPQKVGDDETQQKDITMMVNAMLESPSRGGLKLPLDFDRMSAVASPPSDTASYDTPMRMPRRRGSPPTSPVPLEISG